MVLPANKLNTQPTASSRPLPQSLRVGDLLQDRGIVSEEQVKEALAHQKQAGHNKLLGEVLVELGFVTEQQVMAALADAYGVPFAEVSPEVADPALIDLLPREFLEKQCVLPLFLIRGKLTLAVHEPANVYLVEEVERLTGHQVEIVAATLADIRHALQESLPASNMFVIDELVSGVNDKDLELRENHLADLTDQEADASDSPVIKLVNFALVSAVKEGASDIHFEPDDGVLRVRFRVDGRLFNKLDPPYRMTPAIVSRIKIMAGLDISERRVPQDGAISIMIDSRPVDLRVSTMPGKFGEKVVIRVIDKKNAVADLSKIGFGEAMLARYRKLINQPNGIVLVTGPTGSGKSTTLYGTLAEISAESVNVSTVEDPVEYNLVGVNQFQTNDKAGFTFAGALRALLRQDPDVIMVGEVRDSETAKIATQAALTGHLVFSTLHTNDAPSAITRLFNIGVEPYLVAASVRGVLAQRLVRRLCPKCCETHKPDAPMQRTIETLEKQGLKLQRHLRAVGCNKCRGTGYKGRLGLYELFIPDDTVLDAITGGASLQQVRALANQSDQYTPLRADGVDKINQGLTTLEEVLSVTTM